MPRTAIRLVSLACLFQLSFGTGCNDHMLGGGYDDGPQIDEHGISVPVPPPSLKAAPVQEVDIVGVIGFTDPEPGTIVRLQNPFDPTGYLVEVNPDGTFLFSGIEIDLTKNCLELWSEEAGPNGEMSVHSYFRASIEADDQSVLTTQYFNGC